MSEQVHTVQVSSIGNVRHTDIRHRKTGAHGHTDETGEVEKDKRRCQHQRVKTVTRIDKAGQTGRAARSTVDKTQTDRRQTAEDTKTRQAEQTGRQGATEKWNRSNSQVRSGSRHDSRAFMCPKSRVTTRHTTNSN